MNLKIFQEKAKYHPKAFDFFDFKQLDAFHCPEVLSVIYGDNWESILIIAEDKAFLHSFSKQRIKNTSWYDIEPFLGYAGPVANTDDLVFIDAALQAYSNLCREENVIAEIIRFNPLLQNQKFFEHSKFIDVFTAKEIVIANCYQDEARQLQEYKSATRRNIKNHAIQNYDFRISVDSHKKLDDFSEFYYKFMGNVEAKQEWYFGQDFFKKAEKSAYFKLAEVKQNNEVCSTSIVIEHDLASYYFLGANRIPRLKGAHEFLLLNISIDAAQIGINKLILGGGNSTATDDPLLVYKKKFAKESQNFYMGKCIHEGEAFTALCNEAITRKPEIADANFFLKYRI